jgi:hypothetical protein
MDSSPTKFSREFIWNFASLAGHAEHGDAVAHTASWYAGLLYMRAHDRPPIPFGTRANVGTSGGRGDLQWSENM